MQNTETLTIWREEILAELVPLVKQFERVLAALPGLEADLARAKEEALEFSKSVNALNGNTLARALFIRVRGVVTDHHKEACALTRARLEIENLKSDITDRQDALRQIDRVLNPQDPAPVAVAPPDDAEFDDLLFSLPLIHRGIGIGEGT